MSDGAQRFQYRVVATNATEAIEVAKAQCRDEGWTLRTMASVRQAETPHQWLVTLVVRPKVPA